MNQITKLKADLGHLNLTKLSELSGISRRQFQRVIYDESSPTYRTVQRMLDAVRDHKKEAKKAKSKKA